MQDNWHHGSNIILCCQSASINVIHSWTGVIAPITHLAAFIIKLIMALTLESMCYTYLNARQLLQWPSQGEVTAISNTTCGFTKEISW